MVILPETLYLTLIVGVILTSLSVNISKMKCLIHFTSIILGLLILLFIVLAYFYLISKIIRDENSISKFAIIGAMGVVLTSQIVPVIINCSKNCNPCKLFAGFLCYIFMTPTYTNIFIIYSFCNLHDVSWGNRKTDKKEVA